MAVAMILTAVEARSCIVINDNDKAVHSDHFFRGYGRDHAEGSTIQDQSANGEEKAQPSSRPRLSNKASKALLRI